MSEFEVKEVRPRIAAAVRAEVPADRIREVFDRGFPAVMRALSASGATVVGPPFGYYPRAPGDTIEVVVGFPVDREIAPTGEVVPFTLPGGRVVSTVHVGPYSGLGNTYRRLVEWAEGQGLTLAEGMWESYVTDPGTAPPSEWLTEITWPLA